MGLQRPDLIRRYKATRHGIQLASAIRKLTPEQNIVIYTSALEVWEQIPKELGDIRILEKPFSRQALTGCNRDLLRQAKESSRISF